MFLLLKILCKDTGKTPKLNGQKEWHNVISDDKILKIPTRTTFDLLQIDMNISAVKVLWVINSGVSH